MLFYAVMLPSSSFFSPTPAKKDLRESHDSTRPGQGGPLLTRGATLLSDAHKNGLLKHCLGMFVVCPQSTCKQTLIRSMLGARVRRRKKTTKAMD